jgi:hypothetical protein
MTPPVATKSRTFVCSNICSFCEKSLASVQANTASVTAAINKLKRRKTRCKDHPSVPIIRHVRPAELPPIGEKATGFKGPPHY